MKKNTIVFATLFILIFAAISFALSIFRNQMNKEVILYLTNTRNYSTEDLYSVSTHISKAPVVSTTVIFRDEPYARYFYRKEEGRIYQYSLAPVRGADYDPHYTYRHEE